jgi:hypothetical protein
MSQIFCFFYCLLGVNIPYTPTLSLKADSAGYFVFQKYPSFAKNSRAYYFQIDKKGLCTYKTAKQMLQLDGFYTTTIADSTAVDLFKKIDQIEWAEMAEIKVPSRGFSQKINIQYTGQNKPINQFVGALPLLYNIKPVEKIIEKIIAQSKWKKTTI